MRLDVARETNPIGIRSIVRMPKPRTNAKTLPRSESKKLMLFGEGFDGPEWVLPELWKTYKHYVTAPGRYPKKTKECAEHLITGLGAERLWQLIRETHGEFANNIASELPGKCGEFLIEAHTATKIERTPSEHQEAMIESSREANRLAAKLAEFREQNFKGYDQNIDFVSLQSRDEGKRMHERIAAHHHAIRLRALKMAGSEATAFAGYVVEDMDDIYDLLIGDSKQGGIVPNLPKLLRRVSRLFLEAAEKPPLLHPKGKNVERNYFMRLLIRYFYTTYGKYSRTAVSKIIAIFFPPGISDKDVGKHEDRLPGGQYQPLRG
jgi:hypothetical protein